MLQMYLYRQRPHEAYLWPAPSFKSERRLRFAWCCKAEGYIENKTGRGICDACYERMFDKSLYEPLYAHFLSDGHNLLNIVCTICRFSMPTISPIRTCPPCARMHLNLLTAIEEDVDDDDIDKLEDPIIIYIGGYDFNTHKLGITPL